MDGSEEHAESDAFVVDSALVDDGEEAEQLAQRGVLSFEDFSGSEVPGTPELERYGSNSSEDVSVLSIPINELKVKFDIIGTKIKSDARRKYAVYVIIVLETPKLDLDNAVIERRYSDFAELHAGLKKECPAATINLPFPKKDPFGKTRAVVLEERSRKFEKYLRFIYHQRGVKEAKCFREFFYLPVLRDASIYLTYEDFENCYFYYKLGLSLQQKLADDISEIIPTMCGLVEVCKLTRRFIEGESVASRALELIGYDLNCIYLIPLIKATMELRRHLNMDVSWLSKRLAEFERMSMVDAETAPSLRELAIKRF